MDCKGHAGAYMTLGKGYVTIMSTKHNINTKSSTESELVRADDALPAALWSKYFIESQGYTVTQNIMYQDNQDTLRLEVNGKFSSSKRTKHIKARCFFITDSITHGDVEFQYRRTEIMWCDVLTKPKQGPTFRLDRSHQMNVPMDYDDDVERTRTHPYLVPEEYLYNLAIAIRQTSTSPQEFVGKITHCQYGTRINWSSPTSSIRCQDT